MEWLRLQVAVTIQAAGAKGAVAHPAGAGPHGPVGDHVVVAPDARMDGVLGKLQDGEVVGIITPQI